MRKEILTLKKRIDDICADIREAEDVCDAMDIREYGQMIFVESKKRMVISAPLTRFLMNKLDCACVEWGYLDGSWFSAYGYKESRRYNGKGHTLAL